MEVIEMMRLANFEGFEQAEDRVWRGEALRGRKYTADFQIEK